MEKVDVIRNRLKEQNGFGINRVPPKTKEWFLMFANEEFCEDRGMALKHLCDFYTGILNAGTEHIELELNMLRHEVEELKKEKEEEQEKKKTRLGGK